MLSSEGCGTSGSRSSRQGVPPAFGARAGSRRCGPSPDGGAGGWGGEGVHQPGVWRLTVQS